MIEDHGEALGALTLGSPGGLSRGGDPKVVQVRGKSFYLAEVIVNS